MISIIFVLLVTSQKHVLACDFDNIQNFVVLRHATGTHILDEKLNSLNADEVDRAIGAEIHEAHLTLNGVSKELKETAWTAGGELDRLEASLRMA